MKDLLKSLNDLKDKREGRRPIKKVALKSKKVDLSKIDDLQNDWFESIRAYKSSLDVYKNNAETAITFLDEMESFSYILMDTNKDFENLYEEIMDLGLDANTVLDFQFMDSQMEDNRIDDIIKNINVTRDVLKDSLTNFETK